jgi:hypothetical protein
MNARRLLLAAPGALALACAPPTAGLEGQAPGMPPPALHRSVVSEDAAPKPQQAPAARSSDAAPPPREPPREVITCTALACVPGTRIRFRLPNSFDKIRALSATLCRNETCLTGRLTDRIDPPTAGGVGFAFPDSDDVPRVYATIWVREDGFRGELWWVPDGNPPALANGDRYRLLLTDANQRKVLKLERSVVYQESYPNGKRCDAFPCKAAAIEVD